MDARTPADAATLGQATVYDGPLNRRFEVHESFCCAAMKRSALATGRQTCSYVGPRSVAKPKRSVMDG